MAGTITAYETLHGTRYRVRYRKADRTQTDKRGFKTKPDAALFLSSVTVTKATGEYIDPILARVTVGDLAAKWLAAQAVKLKPSSYAVLEIGWRVHVEPRWAHVVINVISPPMSRTGSFSFRVASHPRPVASRDRWVRRACSAPMECSLASWIARSRIAGPR